MSRRLTLVALGATALCAATPVLAATPMPPMPPKQKLAAVRLPAVERATLSNGMTLVMVPYGSVPQVLISLNTFAGEAETGGRPWLASLNADAIQQGTTRLDSKALADAFADLGGSLGTGASLNATFLRTSALSERAGDAIALLAEVMRQPAYDPADFARIKANKLRELAQVEASPQALAGKLMDAAIYGDSVYGRTIPTRAEVEAMTLDDAKAFHASQMGAQRSTLYVVGRFDAAAVKAAAERAFGDWARGPARVIPEVGFAAGPKLILADRPGSAQTTVRLAFAAPLLASEDDMGFRVMDEMVAGSFSSRITRNIREDKGYTYSPRSQIRVHPKTASWMWLGDITPSVTGAAMKEVFGEIRGLQTKVPTAADAATFQTSTATEPLISANQAASVLSLLQRMDYLGHDQRYLDRFVENSFAVSPAMIRTQAQRYLPLDKMVMVVVGDLKIVEPQLMALPELKGVPVTRVTLPSKK